MLRHLVFAVSLFAFAAGCSQTEDGSEAAPDPGQSESDLTQCIPIFGPIVTGAIEAKYRSLGGCTGFLFAPTDVERPTPDGKGSFVTFLNGSIYWNRATNATFVVRGEIRDHWGTFGWEGGELGWPLSDEIVTSDGGRFNDFEGGSIYWHPLTLAHEVRGAIRDEWRRLGAERGLGYPTSNEIKLDGGVRTDFQRGSITWTRESGKLTVNR